VIWAILIAARDCFRGRRSLQIEVLALRHQLNVLHRSVKRPKLTAPDRSSAARTILEMTLRAAELGDLEERLTKLEAISKSRSWRGDEQSDAAPRGVNGHA
jgi:hypothetical protein